MRSVLRSPFLSILLALLVSATGARAQSPTLALEADATLSISGIAPDAPTTLEITSTDALPITWMRGSDRAGSLPLVLLPGAADPVVVSLMKQPQSIAIRAASVPRVQIDERAYARLVNWRPSAAPADRRATLLLAIVFATMLLLVALLRKGAPLAVLGLSVVFVIVLAFLGARRPTLIARDEPDGTRWFLALEAQTLRMPIREGEPWVPVVESLSRLQTIGPRVIVEGRQARLDLKLPAAAKLLLVPSPPYPGERVRVRG